MRRDLSMKQNCENYMEQYLMLDKHERIPGNLSRHFMVCPKCSSEVKALAKAEKIAAAPLKIKSPLSKTTIQDEVQKINPNYNPNKFRIYIPHWIIFGVLLILAVMSFVALPSAHENNTTTFTYYAMAALAIMAYCASFIGSNLDFFIKKTETTLPTA